MATSYRLTEHFHYWTKHTRTSAMLQPQQFVEISEVLAKEKGIALGDMVKVRSKRGFIKAVAVVSKRISVVTCNGKTVHTVGLPNHWGFTGLARRVPGQHADAVRRRRQHATRRSTRRSWSTSRRPETMCDQNIVAPARPRPPSPPQAPQPRDPRRQAHRRVEVHRLQGLPDGLQRVERPRIHGRHATPACYDNPHDLEPNAWTVMRYFESEEGRPTASSTGRSARTAACTARTRAA